MAGHVVLTAALLAAPAPARGDGGELYVAPVYRAELSTLRHPDAVYAGGSRGKAFLQRGGLRALYGISHAFHAGAELNVTTSQSLVARDVQFQGLAGDLYVDYRDVELLPLLLGYAWNDGGNLWTIASVSGGVAWRRFDETMMLPLVQPPDALLQVQLPVRTAPSWHRDTVVRAMCEMHWRPGSWWALGVGVYGGRMLVSGDWQLGLSLTVDLISGFGPSFY
jgi:hypothetical protein